MDTLGLLPAERALFEALERHGVRFLVIGMGAAVLAGAPVTTQDIGLWFEKNDDERLRLAARAASGSRASACSPPASVATGWTDWMSF